MDRPFTPTQADKDIMEDKGHYRVFDVSGSPFNTGRTSYFHKSIGGYHAAKPGRMQDLYDFYISQNNMAILNMLNAKYFIVPAENGPPQAQQNPNVFGNAWFVDNIKWVDSANEEILSLKEVNLKNTAILNQKFQGKVFEDFKATGKAEISLDTYQPNELVYQTKASTPQFVVFSEMYYQPGWRAYLDGEPVAHVRANYVLRAMNIQAGDHTVTFRFEPQVVNTGSSIALASSILLVLFILGGFYYKSRKRE
jgi:uncharacterized membrane protein YfhO